MKQHLAAIAFNERELEAYVSQMKAQRFETVSDVKKAEDGTYFQVLARVVKESSMPKLATQTIPLETATATA
ncbi:MAG: hypothetical protein EOO10_03835 [Chitinophagaceae bacterium]|nr:MAG: hypothetical protein EOO10_03835 [Chitinophagaceae bacterium]